ncbi:glycosyltransferase family 4 protein [Microbacterium sp. ZXX196]|uniref:glycosyltransferase family 4 protein n=1 Tax=Microbacterium sp. ZXX196 TaxID=2609291 RepID=UPI0012B7817E|nr:glycosyltransferase family 4 protein [Microbacterium sp. ZXX196]MTE23703.1 glycosyltransferase [Microbacterium sp. ZXX196]
MRIAYICQDPGIPIFGRKGASVHVQAVLAVLAGHGHEIDVFCRRTGGDTPAALAPAVAAGALRLRVSGPIRDADPARREDRLLAADAEIAGEVLAAHGWRPYDAIYERYSLFSTAGVAVGRAAGVPVIVEANAPLPLEQAAHRVLVRRADADRVAATTLGGATAVVCVSRPVADWAAGYAPGDRIVVEPNGVDPARFDGVAHATPSAHFTVGFVGTLKPWHGTATLLDALVDVRRAGLPARALIIGDGPGRADLVAHAAARGLTGAVQFAGAVAPEDVAGLLATCHVGVAPYPPGHAYFSPLKVVEYLAAGLPVVASRTGQIPDLVADGETGILVEPGDPRALAAALLALAARPRRAARMGREGRRRALADRTWAAVVDRSFRAAGLALEAVPA